MPNYKLTGRQSCRLSDYHRNLHNAAYERAKAMHDLLLKGWSKADIARKYGITRGTVAKTLRRQGLA